VTQSKDTWTQITDPERVRELISGGKYREDKPTWVRRGEAVWVLVDEIFKAWREARTSR
jgi:hypothetical protein